MKVRCFTAINFSDAILDSIDTFIGEFAHSVSPQTALMKWERRENIHLTLNFFGEIEESMLKQIIGETHRKISLTSEPIRLHISGLGTFPNIRRPRVLWIGCTDESKRVQDLQVLVQSIATDISKGELEFEDRVFTPHITIGRVKALQRPFMLEKAIEKFQMKGIFLEDQIREISFMKSTLGASGSVYNVIENISVANS